MRVATCASSRAISRSSATSVSRPKASTSSSRTASSISRSTSQPYSEARFDLLKPGGELYFSDVYCDRRLPDHVRADPVLYGECLGGALYWNDFLPMAKQAGFLDPRLVTSRPLDITNEAVKPKLGRRNSSRRLTACSSSMASRPACEDYGQAVIYKGSMPEQPDAFELDGHHLIERGKVFPVCGNTWRMLADTRLPRISTSSAISRPTTVFSRAAARRSRSRPATRRRRAAEAVAGS